MKPLCQHFCRIFAIYMLHFCNKSDNIKLRVTTLRGEKKMNVGERIKIRRKELGYNADYLAKHLGVSRSTIFRYEKGEIEKLPTDILEKLSSVLHTTPGYLMGWESESNDTKLLNLFNQLDEDRQENVITYTAEQLTEQKKVIELSSFTRDGQDTKQIDDLAAHLINPNRKLSHQEILKLTEYLSKAKEDYLNKNK